MVNLVRGRECLLVYSISLLLVYGCDALSVMNAMPKLNQAAAMKHNIVRKDNWRWTFSVCMPHRVITLRDQKPIRLS